MSRRRMCEAGSSHVLLSLGCAHKIHSLGIALSGSGWGPVRVGARSGLGPIWAHVGPYRPLWAHMGPIWVLLDSSGHDQIKTFGQISHVSGPKIVF